MTSASPAFFSISAAGPDEVDLAVANQHSAIGNDRQISDKFASHAWSLRAGQSDQLRSVKNGQ